MNEIKRLLSSLTKRFMLIFLLGCWQHCPLDLK